MNTCINNYMRITICANRNWRPALGPTQIPVHWVPGLFAGRKVTGALR